MPALGDHWGPITNRLAFAFHEINEELCPCPRSRKLAGSLICKIFSLCTHHRTISDGRHGFDTFIPEQVLWLRTSSQAIGGDARTRSLPRGAHSRFGVDPLGCILRVSDTPFH